MTEPTRVLVVQADPAERAFQRLLFTEAGMSVVEASSGSEALDFLATDRPDLVVLGRTLPDMDGLELLPRLKSDELEFIPVLVASHRGETTERVRGLQLGFDAEVAALFLAPSPETRDEVVAEASAEVGEDETVAAAEVDAALCREHIRHTQRGHA